MFTYGHGKEVSLIISVDEKPDAKTLLNFLNTCAKSYLSLGNYSKAKEVINCIIDIEDFINEEEQTEAEKEKEDEAEFNELLLL